ncbi:bacteriophage Gp15 family protein [Ethanoligenens harbinense]|uniref:Bacteriophage Gp15 protein n=1 Tax=Ethanoligenens harbinense (strain DSM 18485 / JCM 12961 / CGMCC 1.5033 / YUAN-3) TaxID=663278 RepID=E6U910_ETHHY|nr:bacteriophage Gp15 family protein [Ethanoligenens harbinense]ADU26074.1 putative protein GP15 [Ethanoligenens harbinense YUAN-3]AVQ95217.1 hypothetical protein CXQ68_02540 [Ethanoligenens harbinense YUAN-3]AYF37908.1 hypothetical protein CXP51_02555 [Ethanoligenens harbinense]AYF40628.1 hypothetical protein CN246_02540 [Ethanoligenens harbinense]QCN91462.1 hypothetical protein DRA42_02550 [Ethanoligenens harbinense]
MNILLDELPEAIDGIPIRSDFRVMVQLELMLGDPDVPQDARLPLALDLLYKQPVHDLKQAIDGLLWFYRCGAPLKQDGAGGGGKQSKRAYDFEVDALDIYAAFMQAYGIDLNEVSLHWWKFRSLMIALPEDCKFSRITGYRTMDLSDFKGKERKFYADKQAQYRLRPLGMENLTVAAQEQAAKERVAARFAAAETWARERGA